MKSLLLGAVVLMGCGEPVVILNYTQTVVVEEECTNKVVDGEQTVIGCALDIDEESVWVRGENAVFAVNLNTGFSFGNWVVALFTDDTCTGDPHVVVYSDRETMTQVWSTTRGGTETDLYELGQAVFVQVWSSYNDTCTSWGQSWVAPLVPSEVRTSWVLPIQWAE